MKTILDKNDIIQTIADKYEVSNDKVSFSLKNEDNIEIIIEQSNQQKTKRHFGF